MQFGTMDASTFQPRREPTKIIGPEYTTLEFFSLKYDKIGMQTLLLPKLHFFLPPTWRVDPFWDCAWKLSDGTDVAKKTGSGIRRERTWREVLDCGGNFERCCSI